MADLFYRWATLISIVLEGEKRGVRVGHTMVQKAAYLLQAAMGVDLGFRFRLYHYGPYTEEVWGDLQLLSDMNVLQVEPDPEGYGYWISKGKSVEQILREVDDLPSEEITRLIAVLGNRDTRGLELIATTHYMCSDLLNKKGEASDQDVAKLVTRLKPHFSPDQVTSALNDLRERGWCQ